VDVAETLAALVVEIGGADLLQELLDHRTDAHDLGRLGDELGRVGLVPLPLGGVLGGDRVAVGVDDDGAALVVVLVVAALLLLAVRFTHGRRDPTVVSLSVRFLFLSLTRGVRRVFPLAGPE
jgi:hypothetical protein